MIAQVPICNPTTIRSWLCFLLLTGFVAGCSLSLAQVTFQRTLGNASATNNTSSSLGTHGAAFQTADGGFGVVASHGVSDTDPNVMLVKFNSDATAYWVRTYSVSAGDDENGYAGIQTSDGGYALVGGAQPSNESIFFIRTTSDGTVSWTKKYAGTGTTNAAAYSVSETTDGGFVLGATARTGGPGNFSDMYMIKMSSNGTHQWAKGYSGTNSAHDHGYSALETTDGGFLICGDVFNGSNYDIFVVKTTSDGTPSWTDGINLGGTDIAYSVSKTTDGGYILAGAGGGNNDIVLVKLDNAGACSWAKTYDPSSTSSDGRCVKETADGGFIVAGSRSSSSDYDMVLLKTTSDGTLSWCKVFAGTAAGTLEYGSHVSLCNDGGYIVSGYRDDPGSGKQITYVVKTNSDGNVDDATCSATASVTPTVTVKTPTVVNTPTATTSYNSISSPGSGGTPTITVKNACNNSSSLPVELIDFKGHCRDGAVALSWSTASEYLNDRFVIARSTDGTDYQTVGAIPGKGTSGNLMEYDFRDLPDDNGAVLYYRLSQFDLDGRETGYPPIVISCSWDNGMELILDAARHHLIKGMIKSSKEFTCHMLVADCTGRIIMAFPLFISEGWNPFSFNVQELPPGVYFLRADEKAVKFMVSEQ